VNIEISGPTRQWVYVARSTIEDRLRSLKENRWRKGIYLFFTSLVFILITFFLYPVLVKRFHLPTSFAYSAKNSDGSIGHRGLLLLGFIDLVVIFAVWRPIIFRLNPNLTFLIGKGIERYQSKTRLRANIFWS